MDMETGESTHTRAHEEQCTDHSSNSSASCSSGTTVTNKITVKCCKPIFCKVSQLLSNRPANVRTRDDTEREKARVKRTTFAARLNVPATAWPPFWPSSSRDQRQRSALKASTSQSTSTLALHTSYVYRLLLLLLLGQQLLLPFSFARSFEQASLWRHSLLSVVMPQQVDERICRHCTPFDV